MDYNVIYSSRRTISISVKDEELIVRAPYGTKKEKIESVISSHKDWIEKHIKMQREKNARIGEMTPERIADLKKLAKKILPVKTAYYANIMGLKYGRVTITSAQTRFGSCTSKGNISYSYRVMLYPEEAIDYVVVHELSHLVEMNHSKKFYSVVEKILPDYKKRAKLLK